ncbi:alpha/beta fold hydrolase [Streptomyces sp. NPDC101152]|uniref:alpha/beta fold hydrolase n=1 Tax=Streptomyces sp. NPDC101152 TaxID=3366116 RepID=UPI00382B2210
MSRRRLLPPPRPRGHRHPGRADLPAIGAPTLVVGGTPDTATPVEHAQELADGIPNAVLETIDCGHLAAERPEDLREVLIAHMCRTEAIAWGGEGQRSHPQQGLRELWSSTPRSVTLGLLPVTGTRV